MNIDRVETRLKALLQEDARSPVFDMTPYIDTSFGFELNPVGTLHLLLLASSEAEPLTCAQRGGEGTSVSACNIKHSKGKDFLGVYGDFECLYIRDGYDDLFDAIRVQWRTKDNSVVLLGNAGTGKSWFQIYVLRRLLRRETDYANDLDEYDFVFREVNDKMLLIDIKGFKVYNVTKYDKEIMQYLQRCLYFFEPGGDSHRPPSSIRLPGLATLSPFMDRVKEYNKGPVVTFYFWPWLFTELVDLCGHTKVFLKQKEEAKAAAEAAAGQQQQKDALMDDEVDEEMVDVDGNLEDEAAKAAAARQQQDHDERKEDTHDFIEELWERYCLFGGIVRHIVAGPTKLHKAKKDLAQRLAGLKLGVLQSKALNIDRNEVGENVSGFILCYDGRQAAIDDRSQGKIGFDNCVLRYTSLHVEEEVEKILLTKPIQEKMKVFLDRLNCHIVDLSGKNLEAVATEFLRAAKVEWETKRAGTAGVAWAGFAIKERAVLCEYDISSRLTMKDKVLVPTNTSFPVADMVFSDWGHKPVHAFQCTWQGTHPFTVRALYQLRSKMLRVPHTHKVFVFFIVPDQELDYVKRPEDDFLKGAVDKPLEYTKTEIVAADDLRLIWSNTEVYILRPKLGWRRIINDWLVPGQPK